MNQAELHIEALTFAKQHNIPPCVCPLAVIEKAIEHGAILMTNKLIMDIATFREELVLRQAHSK